MRPLRGGWGGGDGEPVGAAGAAVCRRGVVRMVRGGMEVERWKREGGEVVVPT
jgi:hypothetical protein